ncbi:putative PAS/PAC sensor protein [Desulfofarcimen acetoxidans DSM 771]|uniref:Putative PAS/PAC sensor protein n=1 Tax=Desulfofarcimen acetoxidans (strain ATCC 49208 / DSM 771 / KCTC 5769 / VKM B-1644 / 5575) TaxID=485916 RepID=C8W1V8_DESAS|nr:GAF domain-containing protein [Desulfofarcimen acetoxidans]ACV63579.1 putative PAS/PAC sensor protein [Desulfofarcimen acetoxidans DSM 771]
MKSFSVYNFRHRLLLLVIIAALPVLVLMLYNTFEQRKQNAYNAQEDSMRILRLVTRNHEQLIKNAELFLSVIAKLPEVRNSSYQNCNEIFSLIQKQYPYYDSVGLIRTDGILQCVVPAIEHQVNLSDRLYFQDVMRTKNFAVGDYRISRVTGKASIHFAYPVLNSKGQVIAVLFAEMNMNWLEKLVNNIDFPSGMTITVVDRNGIVLSRHPDADKWIGKAMPEAAIIRTILDKKAEGKADSIGIDGTHRFYSFSPLFASTGSSNLFIYSGVPIADVYAGANSLLIRNLIGICFIMLLVLSIGWYGGKIFFLQAVEVLLAATDRLAGGDLSARTGMSNRKGELCRLGYNFDIMAVALEKRTQLLNQAEIKYRTLVEQIPAVTYITELGDEGITQYISPQVKKLLGYTQKDLINKQDFRVQKIDGSEYIIQLKKITAKCKVGESYQYEYPLITMDNNVVWVYDQGKIELDETSDKWIAHGFLVDISKRKLAEERLAKSRDFYLSLFEEFPSMIWRSGIDAKCNYFNKSWLNFTGRTMEEEKGGGWATGVHPEDYDRCINTYLNAFNGRASFEMEYRLRRFDGKYRWVVDIGRPFYDQEGNFFGYIGSCYDVTERKQEEERINRDAAQSEALADILQTMAEAGLNCENILKTVTRKISILLGDASVIWLLSEEGDCLRPVAYYHQEQTALDLMDSIFSNFQQYPVENVMSSVIMEAKSLFIPKIELDKLRKIISPDYFQFFDQCAICSLIVVPLRVRGRVIGSLEISRYDPCLPYNEDDLKFIHDLADRLAASIAYATLYDENVRALNRLNALYQGAEKLVQSSIDLNQLTDDVTRTCVKLFGLNMAYLGRTDSSGNLCLINQYPQGSYFHSRNFVSGQNILPGQELTDKVIQSGYPYIIDEVESDPLLDPWRQIVIENGIKTFASFPLINKERSFGTLNLCSEQKSFFTLERVEFFQAYTRMVAATMDNVRLFEEAGRRLKHVEALRNIDMAITSSLDLRVTFQVVMDQVISQLGIDAAVILLLNPYSQTLEYAAGRGFRTNNAERTSSKLGESNAGRAATERRIVHIPNLEQSEKTFLRPDIPDVEGFVTYYGAPLIAKGQVKGVLEIFQRKYFKPDQEWLDFLETLAGQAAIAIDNAGLFNELQRFNDELRLAYDATIEGWSYALDLRDKETEGHSRRVTELTLLLSRAMGMNEADLLHVRWGALLHDIGKMGIPDHILLKPGALNEEEWDIMRRHPVYAYEMLSPINYLRPALDIPYCHHEKWDGSGYPRGIKGLQIPLAARIFAVIDVWDALCSDRPYRSAWPKDRAREFILEQSGKHFDPKVVEKFISLENF